MATSATVTSSPPAALAAGALALVVERPLGLHAPEIVVESARAAMGPLAARFNGDPTRELKVVGVTGTNGKTTTAHLVRALLQAGGERCGLLGTVGSLVAGSERPALRTTPEAIDLQADFRAMLDGGERYCAMEVSSHALALGRTDGTRFSVAVFTNLTQDHLDFHPTMEDYFQAKRRLFESPATKVDQTSTTPTAGAWRANWRGPSPLRSTRPPTTRLGMSSSISPARAFGCARRPASARSRCRCRGASTSQTRLAALAAVHSLGVDLDTLVAALERGVRVPGRVERVDAGQDFAVLVDYAHTPDSLANVLGTAHEVGERRVICVFGAGGDRDRGKRPLMGEIGARLADVLIVTSDNPRSEDPEAIIAEIMRGAKSATRPPGAPPVACEVDRRAAIERAVALAEEGDVLVIAGKGHEQGQEFAGGVKLPFDDVTVAREALGARVG